METLVMLLLGSAMILLLLAVVLCVLYILAYWRIFSKAGEAGWKALIPIYSTYTEYKIIWNVKMFVLAMVFAVLTAVFDRLEGGAVILFYLASIGTLVMNVLACVKMSFSFGHGAGFAIGLIFLNPVFLLILAFDSSEYLGPGGRYGDGWQKTQI